MTNRFSLKVQDNLRVTGAISGAWRTMFYMDYFEVKKPVLHCEDVKQAKLFWKAYKHFFNINYDHKITWSREFNSPLAMRIPFEGDFVYEEMKKRLKFKRHPSHTCFSFLSNKKDHKGLDDQCLQDVISLLDPVAIDLSDSRNFKNINELITKLTILFHANLYIGSDCSWNNIAPVFGVPTILTIQEYPYNSTSVLKQIFSLDRSTGYPIGYEPTDTKSSN